jgi:hypothetical protein
MSTHLLAVVTTLLLSPPTLAQPPSDDELYQRLMNGPDTVKALEAALGQADKISTLTLYLAAKTALQEDRLEDSAFLFYAAQLRARFDRECFPPQARGSADPLVAYEPVSQALGGAINPQVMAKPKIFARALARLEKWTPKAPREYSPGYEFTERKTEPEAQKLAQQHRTEFISRMTGLSSLLNDEEYFAAFRVIQAQNLGDSDKRPTREAVDQATDIMKRLEKEKGLKGVFSK